MQRQKPLLSLLNLQKTFTLDDVSFSVLKGVSLGLYSGEIVGLVGQSGAGKSTLLHIAGLLEQPTEGNVKVEGIKVNLLSDYERTLIRRNTMGFVYQSHRLLPDFSALENVMLPQIIAGKSKREASLRAEQLLAQVGLEKRLHHRPAKLSGGEQQRVALMRAMANRPKILLADEPTGNLDSVTAEEVFQLLVNVVRTQGIAAFIATHNAELAQRMDRVITLKDGMLVSASKL